LSITGEVGLNPALESFRGLYDNGDLAILNSVGYPNPIAHISEAWTSGIVPAIAMSM
jgi:uncharacterized protein (DUF1501 family)